MNYATSYSEAEICDLFTRLHLHAPAPLVKESVPNMQEVSMLEDQGYQSDTLSETSTTTTSSVENGADPDSSSGCGYLQAIRAQIASNKYGTSSGDYIEAIFTHRELFMAHPRGHRQCALEFCNLAQIMDSRPWRSDRDGDSEAAAAFRYEAEVIAKSW